MTYALDFTSWHDDVEERDRRCPEDALDACLPRLNISEIERFLNWIGLLAKFEYKVTPDVVAVYTIATRQEGLLPCWFPYLCEGPEYRSIRMLQDNAPYVSHANEYIGIRTGADTDIPKELFTMAEHYMYERVSDYVQTLYDSIGNAALYSTPIGTTLPKALCVALRSFGATPAVVPSVDKLINNVKSLYATVMPQVSASRYNTYGCSCCNRPLNTKIPPTIRLNKEEEIADSGDSKLFLNNIEKADAAVIRGCNVLWDHIGKLATILKDAQLDYTLTDRMMIKEAFCLACEIAIWIIHHRECPVRMDYYPRPKMAYDEVNLLIAKGFVNRHGSTAQSEAVNGVDKCPCGDGDYVRYLAGALGLLSPNAALCLGEGIGRMFQYCGIRYNLERFTEMCIKTVKIQCPEVVAYFRTETSAASHMYRTARRIAAMQDKRAGETAVKEGVAA